MNTAKTSWNFNRAVELAKQIGKSSSTFPPNLMELARRLQVYAVEPANISIDGYLGRLANGELVIRYKETNSRVRNRFTIAHELGHILLYRASGREIPDRTTRSLVRCSFEERYANRLASELLMPQELIEDAITTNGIQWKTIYQQCRRFDVSFTAMLMRFLEVSVQPFVVLKATLDPTNPQLVSRCRCLVSQQHRILFARPPIFEAQDIIDASEDGRLCGLTVFVANKQIRLNCNNDGWLRLGCNEIGFLCR